MSVKDAKINNFSAIIVDKSELMRNILKSMLVSKNHDIHEASDEAGALSLAVKHNPRIIFVSMEDNHWPTLVKSLKKDCKCIIVAYSTGITRESVARAYFAGVDDILINPQNQRERIENYMMNNNCCADRYYRFPNKKSATGFSHLKKFFWLQFE